MDELVYAEDLASCRARVGVHELAHNPHPCVFLSVILRDSDSLFTVVCTGGGRGTEPAQQGGRKHRRQPGLGFVRTLPVFLTCTNGPLNQWDSSCVATLFAFFRMYMGPALKSLFLDDTVSSGDPGTVPLSRPCLLPCSILCVHACGSKATPGPGILPALAMSSPALQCTLVTSLTPICHHPGRAAAG